MPFCHGSLSLKEARYRSYDKTAPKFQIIAYTRKWKSAKQIWIYEISCIYVGISNSKIHFQQQILLHTIHNDIKKQLVYLPG